ncbi:YHS domain-containing protein [Acidianus brierleyi]|uniref:Transcriptional regulator n=1 Tax=Acidianus brierleyi TaxID=41673 RepID=A0A2U9IBI6_9CREN|nr:YHS domain-containing protein [Acidianus brierleyi]AWR93372.1 YHS domain-containing protein [Acidianus brierleyi]
MKDPVCGEEVNNTTYKYTYKSVTYYFCSPMCMAEFKKNPDKYVKNIKEK